MTTCGKVQVKIAEHIVTGHKVAVKILHRKKIRQMDMEEKGQLPLLYFGAKASWPSFSNKHVLCIASFSRELIVSFLKCISWLRCAGIWRGLTIELDLQLISKLQCV